MCLDKVDNVAPVQYVILHSFGEIGDRRSIAWERRPECIILFTLVRSEYAIAIDFKSMI